MDSVRLASLLVVSVVNVGLALIVYLRDPHNRANRAFARAVVVSVAWLGLAFLSDLPQLHDSALLLNRVTLATSVILGASLVHFALVFPKGPANLGRWWLAFVGTAGVLAIATATTPLVISSVSFRSDGTDVSPGVAFAAYGAWVLVALVTLFVAMGRNYRALTGRGKTQLKYVFLGIGVFVGLSVAFGLLLPLLTGSYETTVLNTFTPLALFGFISYAMVKHRLMDMRAVVLRGVVYTVLVVALAACFLSLARLVRSQLFGDLGVSADTAFVLAGLAAVFAFQPLRSWLESITDSLFHRRRYDQQTLLERLAEELVATVHVPAIAEAVSGVLAVQLKSSMIVFAHEEAGGVAVYGAGIEPDDPALCEVLATAPSGHAMLAEDFDEDSPMADLLKGLQVRVVGAVGAEAGSRAVLLLGEKRSGEVYTERDMRFLCAVLPEVAIALKTAELFEQRDQRVRELTALNQLAAVLGEDIKLEALLEHALSEAVQVVAADGGSIMLLDQATQTLTVDAAIGLSGDVVRDTKVALGDRISGWVAEHRTSILMLDEDMLSVSKLRRDGVKSALSIPLVSRERVIGVLNLTRSGSAVPFTQENMSVVTSFAGQLAVAIENAQLYSDLEGHVIGTITALAAAVEAKDPYTFGHSSEVTNLALAIAAEMGLDDGDTEILRKAALLHDIGKIGIAGSILNKPGRLSDEEYLAIKQHPEIAANILSSLEFLEEIVPLVLHHHERYDGRGYPAGIGGPEIPLGARIIGVADSYDAMTSDRTYRQAMPATAALDELRKHAGTQFDPDVVAAYLRVVGAEAGRDAGIDGPERPTALFESAASA